MKHLFILFIAALLLSVTAQQVSSQTSTFVDTFSPTTQTFNVDWDRLQYHSDSRTLRYSDDLLESGDIVGYLFYDAENSCYYSMLEVSGYIPQAFATAPLRIYDDEDHIVWYEGEYVGYFRDDSGDGIYNFIEL